MFEVIEIGNHISALFIEVLRIIYQCWWSHRLLASSQSCCSEKGNIFSFVIFSCLIYFKIVFSIVPEVCFIANIYWIFGISIHLICDALFISLSTNECHFRSCSFMARFVVSLFIVTIFHYLFLNLFAWTLMNLYVFVSLVC